MNPLPPHAQLVQLGTAYWISRIVHAAALLGLADQLADTPKSAAELAGVLEARTESLQRFMRALTGLGILSEVSDRRFVLTPLGQALRTGAEGAARTTILTFGSDWFTAGYHALIHAIRTGETSFEHVHGVSFFEYLAQHPAAASQFSEAMIGHNGGEPPLVAAAYDFSMFRTIVDVGGATGHMLAEILRQHPSCRGVLYDRPHVVVDAPKLLDAHGVRERVRIESGDFFESVPDAADAYILSHVVQDWGEPQLLTLLGNVRKAMLPHSRLLIVEWVLPPGDEPHISKLLDMVMLAMVGGKERTPSEYAELLNRVGLRLTRILPTASPTSIVEAVIA